MITEDRLHKALVYLAETDETCAELKTDVSRQEFVLKRIKAQIYLHSDGTVDERKSKAETATDTIQATDNYLDALKNHETVNNKRKSEQLIVDVWRSFNANRRQGGI